MVGKILRTESLLGLDRAPRGEGSEDPVPNRPLACTSSFGVRGGELTKGLLSGVSTFSPECLAPVGPFLRLLL